jgi:uncharacterized protein (TIGR03435 family)
VRRATVLVGLTGLFLFAPHAARGQAPAKLEFEVASVRPHVPGSGPHTPGCTGDRFSSVGVLFGNVLQWAYDFPGVTGREFFESVRATGVNRNFFDIQAKAGRPIASESECHLMVQALLADRFKLAFHWESKDAELSDLVVARGGPKIREALATDEGTDVDVVVDGRPIRRAPPDPDGSDSKGMTMRQLAQLLTISAAPGGLQQIVDETGLEGRYNIDLRFSTTVPAGAPDFLDPPLDAALQQLGLRLEKHKGSVKVPVLDHIEPPDPGAN